MYVFHAFLSAYILIICAGENYELNNEQQKQISHLPDLNKNFGIIYDEYQEMHNCSYTFNNDDVFCVKQFAKLFFNPLQRNVSLRNTARTVSDILETPRIAFRTAQKESNSTDEILDKFDVVIASDSKNKNFDLIIERNIMVLSFNVKIVPVSGIAIFKNENSITHEIIYRNSTASSVLSRSDLLVAAHLPIKLLKQIEAALEIPVVAITIFFKESLFVESENAHSTAGIAFGVLIPGFRSIFQAPVRLVYRIEEDDVTVRECAHWFYGMKRKGIWKEDNAAAVCGNVEICEYYHVTHFGMLVSSSTSDSKKHKYSLDVITFIGSVLSLLGIFGIFTTAVLFRDWRKNKGNLILLNYALATLLEIALLYFSGYIKEKTICDNTWCFWSGIILHYVVLAQFFWVLVISYLQYKRYVQIVGAPTTRLVLKSSLVGWLSPLAVIIPLAIFSRGSYYHNNANICYPTGLALYLGVLLPILLIVLTNLGVFVLILKSLFWGNKDIPRLADNITILKMRLVFLLFFQLGISWIFGFLGNVHITFTYLFCLTATNQGFVVFLLFIVFNEASRRHYRKLFGYKKEPKIAEPSTSTRNVSH